MLIDNSQVRSVLRKIVFNIAADSPIRDDLMQEALIHLWQTELHRPGQTRSWYLRSCWFHLRNHLDRGRSIDALKHRHRRGPDPDRPELTEEPDIEANHDACLPDLLIARDIFSLLAGRIKPGDSAVLGFLVDGFSVRDIARKLSVSHQAVSKHRRQIAAVARELGIMPSKSVPSRRKSAAHADL